jgi:hypothetical protein
MTDKDIVDAMKLYLVPQGTADVVILRMDNRFYRSAFINECIKDLERMPVRIAMGENPTALERLAFHVLCDSAYLDITHAEQKEEFSTDQILEYIDKI